MSYAPRQVEDDLERFRALVESREIPTEAWRGHIDSGRVTRDETSA